MLKTGFRTFTLIWSGQFVSMLGTGMTRFALMIWAYQQTGEATTLALLGFFAWLPFLLVSPIAGIWVDRLDRRKLMIGADIGSGLLTLFVLAMYANGQLALWHIYLFEGLSSVFDAFQHPAYSALSSTLLEKEQYARGNGMRTLAYDGTLVGAPILAGVLLPVIGVSGVMAIDVITFGAAMATLAVAQVPSRPTVAQSAKGESFARQLSFGTRYIFARSGLLGLMLIYVGIEFFATLTYFAVLPTLILKRTGGDEAVLGMVQAALGFAGVAGGILVTWRGLPRKKIHAVLACCGLSFLLGDFLFAVGRSLPVWIVAASVAAIFIPFIVGAKSTIWQIKVHPDVQGRVFTTARTFEWSSKPIAYLLAGPLADRVLEPAMQPAGALSPWLGWLVGTGPGAGIACMFVCTSVLGALVSFGGYLFRSVRNVEQDLPDHDNSIQSLATDSIHLTQPEAATNPTG